MSTVAMLSIDANNAESGVRACRPRHVLQHTLADEAVAIFILNAMSNAFSGGRHIK